MTYVLQRSCADAYYIENVVPCPANETFIEVFKAQGTSLSASVYKINKYLENNSTATRVRSSPLNPRRPMLFGGGCTDSSRYAVRA